MKKAACALALLWLVAAAAWASGLATARGACQAGKRYLITDASAADDCDLTGGGSVLADCVCSNGVWTVSTIPRPLVSSVGPVALMPGCNLMRAGQHYSITNSASTTTCDGTTGTSQADCVCLAGQWLPALGTGGGGGGPSTYAASASAAGPASSGDSATAFFTTGTVEAARLPDLSAHNGAVTDAQVPDTVTIALSVYLARVLTMQTVGF